MKKYDVYVSYSYQDEECAQKVLKVLETKRLSYCTKEQGMKVGEVWAKCISDSIKNSSVFLLLCSESSSKSQACNNELMMAIMNDSGIFPLIIDDSSPSLMPSLMGYLHTDLKNKNWPEYLSQLVLKIRERDSNVDFELGSASASKYEEGNTCKADTWRSRCIGQDQKDALLKLSCDKQSLVYLDGDFLCEIGAKEVVKVPIEYGAYVLGFEDKEAPDSYRVVSVEIDKGQTSKSVIVEMPKDINAKRKPIAMRNELKCFIAGSKTLKRERQ